MISFTVNGTSKNLKYKWISTTKTTTPSPSGFVFLSYNYEFYGTFQSIFKSINASSKACFERLG
ncbi:hypothetical protein [Winogradskyella wichelsiae]|uniref:hypothetical protein n=1 Tax=Winogradskyella wichelsiae TaxID=2697007 RepID=UPI003F4A94DA